ncbi:hypothetical protein, partial [Campylobacter pinnipediorum]|uniref:hypothetical protein n=1 Tax=Campylobacter pinnipediorum TaxID=1965231 RepID=UPI001C5BBC44
MKISKIACGALLGAMIAINAYGDGTSGSSLDDIKNMQTKKQELEKAAQDENSYTNKFKEEKEKAENAIKKAKEEKKYLEVAEKLLEESKKNLEGLKKGANENFIKALNDKIVEQEKIIKQKQEEIKQKQEEIKQKQEVVEKADKALKVADKSEARAKIIADFNKELDAKMEEAKKDRAEAIVADKSLKFDNNEAQTVLSLLSVTNNEEVNDLLLNVDAEDIAILAKNINSSLEEVSKEFKDNKTVDTLLSSVGSAINSRL